MDQHSAEVVSVTRELCGTEPTAQVTEYGTPGKRWSFGDGNSAYQIDQSWGGEIILAAGETRVLDLSSLADACHGTNKSFAAVKEVLLVHDGCVIGTTQLAPQDTTGKVQYSMSGLTGEISAGGWAHVLNPENGFDVSTAPTLTLTSTHAQSCYVLVVLNGIKS